MERCGRARATVWTMRWARRRHRRWSSQMTWYVLLIVPLSKGLLARAKTSQISATSTHSQQSWILTHGIRVVCLVLMAATSRTAPNWPPATGNSVATSNSNSIILKVRPKTCHSTFPSSQTRYLWSKSFHMLNNNIIRGPWPPKPPSKTTDFHLNHHRSRKLISSNETMKVSGYLR